MSSREALMKDTIQAAEAFLRGMVELCSVSAGVACQCEDEPAPVEGRHFKVHKPVRSPEPTPVEEKPPKAEKKKAPPKKEETAPKVVSDLSAIEGRVIDRLAKEEVDPETLRTDCLRLFPKVSRKHGKDKLRELMKAEGVGTLPDIDANKLPAFKAKLEGLV